MSWIKMQHRIKSMPVVAAITEKGYNARPIPGGERVSIGVLHNKGPVDAALFAGFPGGTGCDSGDPAV